MKPNYDEIIRDSFSEKIEVPEEYQQKIIETLKQARITSSQKKQYPVNKYFQTDSRAEGFLQRRKISVKACLSLTGGICACLGLAIVLSIFLKQGSPRKDFNNIQNQYVKISTTPTVTENTVTADNSLRTEIPADTEPQGTKLPLDTTNPTLTVPNTQIPEKKQKNDTGATQTETNFKPDNRTTSKPKKNSTTTPKRNETTRSPELAQVQTSYTPETIKTPQQTTTPASIESPEKTKTPENTSPHLTSVPMASKMPSSEIVFPTAEETPTVTPVRAGTIPNT